MVSHKPFGSYQPEWKDYPQKLTKRIEIHLSNHKSRAMTFMSIFFSLFCDWSILLGRVDNPMRDDLDIVWSEIFRSSSKKQFG